jgi:virginiamycin B lyase
MRFALPVAVMAFLSVAQAGAQQFPAGPGKDTLETKCGVCHSPEQVIAGGGRTSEEWNDVVREMIDNGAEIPGDEVLTLVAYLAKNWPPKKTDVAASITPGAGVASVSTGNTAVVFKEWDVPTPNSRPHDPLAASDGSIWYTSMNANVLGRFDPKTQQFKEFTLKTPASGPHGLTEDRAGNIWFTANTKGYVGKLDPKTGQINEYPMLDPAARDPHTPVFDQMGNLWFTIQSANKVGRFIPASGELTLRNSPTPRSLPYGIVVSSKGVPFYVEFGANKVASIDPQTMVIREWTLPNADSRPRRVAIDANDIIWYSDYSRGFVGRLDPATGKVSEWPSPGGHQSQPYGIAVINGMVWYSESGVEPNTLVRFDPGTESFQTWKIPSGGGVVRNVSVTKEGNLVLAESGVNKIALVEIGR